jgi:hypothetical protein
MRAVRSRALAPRHGQVGFWGSPRSTAGAFLDSSGGFTLAYETAAERPSRVVTVQGSFDVNTTVCDILAIADDADAAAVSAFGLTLNVYTFK